MAARGVFDSCFYFHDFYDEAEEQALHYHRILNTVTFFGDGSDENEDDDGEEYEPDFEDEDEEPPPPPPATAAVAPVGSLEEYLEENDRAQIEAHIAACERRALAVCRSCLSGMCRGRVGVERSIEALTHPSLHISPLLHTITTPKNRG